MQQQDVVISLFAVVHVYHCHGTLVSRSPKTSKLLLTRPGCSGRGHSQRNQYLSVETFVLQVTFESSVDVAVVCWVGGPVFQNTAIFVVSMTSKWFGRICAESAPCGCQGDARMFSWFKSRLLFVN